MSCEHLETLWRDPDGTNYEMGITLYTMLLCCKMHALSWCYRDGAAHLAYQKLTPEQREEKAGRALRLNDDQRARMVLECPSLLEVTSYVFFCQACALGIFFEFRDYKAWVERAAEYRDVPAPFAETFRYLAEGAACLGLVLGVQPYIPMEHMWGEAYWERPYWQRLGYYYCAMWVRRSFFYAPFKLSGAAISACGLTYNGKDKDGKHRWDKIVPVHVAEIETAASTMEMLRGWNYQVHLWLKFYVQARLVGPDQRAGTRESMATFMVSAFWHGFYPFYHVMFFFAAVLAEVTKDVYKCWIFFQWIP